LGRKNIQGKLELKIKIFLVSQSFYLFQSTQNYFISLKKKMKWTGNQPSFLFEFKTIFFLLWEERILKSFSF